MTGKPYEEAVAALARMNAGGRLIDPGEVALAVARLIDDDSTNGQTIIIDGSGPIPEPAGAGERTDP